MNGLQEEQEEAGRSLLSSTFGCNELDSFTFPFVSYKALCFSLRKRITVKMKRMKKKMRKKKKGEDER